MPHKPFTMDQKLITGKPKLSIGTTRKADDVMSDVTISRPVPRQKQNFSNKETGRVPAKQSPAF